NISAFGGDPDNVTIVGTSAGGTQVATLLSSPLTAGLFHKAIISSAALGQKTLAGEEAQGERVITERYSECDLTTPAATIACMRSKSMPELVLSQPVPGEVVGGSYYFYDVSIDGHVLTAPIFDVLSQGAGKDVPVIVHSTSDEAAATYHDIVDDAKA